MLAFLAMFVNWYMLALVVGLLAIAAIIYFTLGPVKLAQIAIDARTWIGVAVLVGLVTLYADSKKIADQQQVIQNQATQHAADKDAGTVLEDRSKTQTVRQTQQTQQKAVIQAAPQGQAVDDLMDEIAHEQTTPEKSK